MKRRLAYSGLALVALLLVLGVRGSSPITAAPSDSADVSLRTFTQMLDLIERNYIDEVKSKKLIHGAIRGMLSTLDPHSTFLDAKTYREMREEQKGSFSGLGIVISMKGEDKQLTVISPIDGTPAFRAGIRAGDHIAEIEGESTHGISIDDALNKLRGPKGTKVTITIQREGYDQPLEFTLVRDDIPTVSIPSAFLIRPSIGYVRIKNFTQTTDSELKEKLHKLKVQGMKKLILDLRWNPGGLLEQAVRVSDRFLKRDAMIVYTKGRLKRESDREYHAVSRTEKFTMPLIILVNKGSASASEIVSGAMQDHDRALVVGTTTWGKGLVQTVYPLSMRTGLALTTAKYYTPSGRLIQRDYRSFEDYVSGKNIAPEDQRQTRFTDSGRTVRGGGGISPDVVVELDEPDKFVDMLERKMAFFDFSVVHITNHPEPPDPDTFEITPDILDEFKKFLRGKEIAFEEDQIQKNLAYIKLAIKAEILAYHLGMQARLRVLAERDNQIQKAIELFAQGTHLPLMAEHEQPAKKAPAA
ncbi:MAG: S41 family peptidase, partial [Acidobacteriota bacterium]